MNDRPELVQAATAQTSIAQDREQLALVFRLAERFGFHEGICNHFSVRLDTEDERYLINPYGLHWSEMQASSLLMIDGQGTVLEGEGEVESTARFIHVAGHRANSRHKALLHTHMPWATSLTLLAGDAGQLQMAHQTAARFHARILYESRYDGLALDASEGDRLASAAAEAPLADVIFLAHHGVVVGAPTIALAFDDLYYLERACRQQVLAMQTGALLKLLPQAVVEETAQQIRNDMTHFADHHLTALGRVLANSPNWTPVF